ncbi:cyclin-dependent kinase-like [Raphidocelis subcapitata]|uniref:cyclin-dependent kinase n=1 Tax=Raphidocelis subcapitata TaxID=307507 RepID=A0A2V0PEY0_9CHLO|nr:cyclin-dependent kinase-like [Raphidocelis subcapitata]|eukprot:GBF98411.1 cyclin-dependent kinase-like [Raphidocelis subcapitata]
MDDWTPELHRRYHRLRVLGHGAFGEVVAAVDRATGQRVAVKRVFSRAGTAAGAALREARALRALRHPNVVALLDATAEGPCLHLVQELCATDLSRLLDATYGQLPAPVAKALMRQLLAALAACHGAGLMHRDVKPSNLLLGFDGCLKLGDFGLARAVAGGEGSPGGSPEDSGPAEAADAAAEAEAAAAAEPTADADADADSPPSAPGSPAYSPAVATRWYRAPELLFGASKYDGAAVDVWGAGAVFAEMLGLCPLAPGASDIGQLALLQRLLGQITPRSWPGVEKLPDWGKVRFDPPEGGDPGSGGADPAEFARAGLAGALPDAGSDALDLLASLLSYLPAGRPSAAQALADPYFQNPPAPAEASEVAAFAAAALSTHARAERALGALAALGG